MNKTKSKKPSKKVTTVHAHSMHVPVSQKNPDGITIRDQHLRRLKGTYLDREEIDSIFKNYDRSNITYPGKGKLGRNSDKYDDVIAVWTDYFNKKFKQDPPFDPDMIKALIASESQFQTDPAGNAKATGINSNYTGNFCGSSKSRWRSERIYL